MADVRIRDNVSLLARALPHVGHYQTRNRGTLGGSVAHADPSAEIPLSLATLGGEIEFRSKRARRRIKARDFLQSALVTAREPDELITALYWPVRRPGQGQGFIEFAIREGDYAIVAVACVIDINADGAVALFCSALAVAATCRNSSPSTIWPTRALTKALSKASRTMPRDGSNAVRDLLATAPYRRQLASVLAGKAIVSAYAEGQSRCVMSPPARRPQFNSRSTVAACQ